MNTRNCLKCQAHIPLYVKIEGVNCSLQRRKYCLVCSPYKSGNTKKLHLENNEPKENRHSRNYRQMSKEEKRQYNDITYNFQKYRRTLRKIELINKLGGCCSSCGYNKNLTVLSFHHKNPNEKKFTLDSRNMYNKSIPELLEEASKCELLCANCHMEHHYPFANDWQNINTNLKYSDFRNNTLANFS
jgi:hypothetical protein